VGCTKARVARRSARLGARRLSFALAFEILHFKLGGGTYKRFDVAVSMERHGSWLDTFNRSKETVHAEPGG
jgi:hypothetical protein